MGGFYYYGIDSLYIYLVVPAIIIMLWSADKGKNGFFKVQHTSFAAYRSGRRAAGA